jgi:hypothetical protein
MPYTIEERANPAAVGFRWQAEETLFELTWIRGAGWLLGMNRGQGWTTTSAPGVETASTLKDARRIAAAFVNGKEQ